MSTGPSRTIARRIRNTAATAAPTADRNFHHAWVGLLTVVRQHYNGTRLPAGIGYVTPTMNTKAAGQPSAKSREADLETARLRRLTYHR
jgi:hypothetical protein